MVYVAIAACLGWVATSCLLVYLLVRVLDRQQEERQAHRIEVDVQRQENLQTAQAHRAEIASLTESHRQEIAALNQARIEEVANLLQRIQAPDVAVSQHAGHNALPDPPPVDLEDDQALIAEAEQRLEAFARDLEGVT